MSWTEYLANLKKEGLKHAAICGADGSWIQVSDGSNVSFSIRFSPIVVAAVVVAAVRQSS
jgi:hypothetical protein